MAGKRARKVYDAPGWKHVRRFVLDRDNWKCARTREGGPGGPGGPTLAATMSDTRDPDRWPFDGVEYVEPEDITPNMSGTGFDQLSVRRHAGKLMPVESMVRWLIEHDDVSRATALELLTHATVRHFNGES